MGVSSQLWELIRSGNTQQGLDLARNDYLRDPSECNAIELGIVLIWLEDYGSALEHFQRAIKTLPDPHAEFYGMTGVTKWCLGDFEGAVRAWKAGYVASSENELAGLRLPLLVLTAAILEPVSLSKAQAAQPVFEWLDKWRTGAWPTPLAKVMLGLTLETRPEQLSVESSGIDSFQQKWAAQFYLSIRAFDSSGETTPDRPELRREELKNSMRRLADTSLPDCNEIGQFTSLVHCEAYFIARYLAHDDVESQPPSVSPWSLLRSGNTKIGLAQILENYPERPSVSNIMTLGVAYMWSRDYGAAWNHYQDAIRNERWSHDTLFGMAGAAKWCMNEPDTAVECWNQGLHCDYGDAAGASVGNRLLLFSASILNSRTAPLGRSISLLEEKTSDPRIVSWPGPLVEFCLGRADVDLKSVESKYYFHSQQIKLSFYRYLLDLKDNKIDRKAFNLKMNGISDTSHSWLAEQKAFTSLIWNEEFFIARHEASFYRGS